MPEFEEEREFLEGVCEQCQRACLDSLHEIAHCGHCDCCCQDDDGQDAEMLKAEADAEDEDKSNEALKGLLELRRRVFD